MHGWNTGLSVFVWRVQLTSRLLEQRVSSGINNCTHHGINVTFIVCGWKCGLSVCERWQWSVWLHITYTHVY